MITSLIGFGLFALFNVFILYVVLRIIGGVKDRRNVDIAWELGFDEYPKAVAGIVDGVRVMVELPETTGGDAFRIRIGDGSLTPDVRVESRVKTGHPEGHPTGDRDFDERVALVGDPMQAAVRFDAETRTATLLLLAEGAYVEGGSVWVELSKQDFRPEPIRTRLRTLVPHVKTLIDAWKNDEETLVELSANAKTDPVSGVRAKSLEHFAEWFPNTRAARDAFAHGLTDAELGVRLVAAEHVELASDSERSRSVLALLTSGIRDEGEPGLRSRAISVLQRRFASDVVVPILAPLLHDPSGVVRNAALEALVVHGWNVEDGALSIAETSGGELSLSDGGEVSLVPKKSEG